MPHPRTLITAEQLVSLMADAASPLVVLDCGFDLADAGAGERAHRAGHIPGAHHAHLDRDLAGEKTGSNGRHPLPDRAAFAACAGRWGIAPGVQVVTYDDQGGPYAARAWWLLYWLGHDGVTVLDGGAAAWRAAGGDWTDLASVPRPLAPYPAGEQPAMPTVDAAALQAALGRVRLFDARAGERFRGEVEPLDAVAGHIPGATSRPFKDNLRADGRFKPAAQLRADFDALGGGDGPVVHQCGSGVTACHNLLAMAYAGYPVATLYAGSWSEWCSDAARPVARG